MTNDEKQKTRELASELAYSVSNWRGRSPGFMQAMVRRWEEKIDVYGRLCGREALGALTASALRKSGIGSDWHCYCVTCEVARTLLAELDREEEAQ